MQYHHALPARYLVCSHSSHCIPAYSYGSTLTIPWSWIEQTADLLIDACVQVYFSPTFCRNPVHIDGHDLALPVHCTALHRLKLYNVGASNRTCMSDLTQGNTHWYHPVASVGLYEYCASSHCSFPDLQCIAICTKVGI